MRVFPGRILTGQNRIKLRIDFIFELRGQGAERTGIDHVTAAVFENSVEQLEVLQGSSIGRVPAVLAEGVLESRRAFHAAILQGVFIAEEKVFTNLASTGNVGTASVFMMLHELLRSGRAKSGQKILCVVPESARFNASFALLTVQ